MQEKNKEYFKKIPHAPDPISFRMKRRASFNEVDVMGIVWYGRYAIYFEEAQREGPKIHRNPGKDIGIGTGI